MGTERADKRLLRRPVITWIGACGAYGLAAAWKQASQTHKSQDNVGKPDALSVGAEARPFSGDRHSPPDTYRVCAAQVDVAGGRGIDDDAGGTPGKARAGL